MSNENVTPMKGFRQPAKPTKGEVLQENATLGQQLTQRLQGLQQFFGNLINQLMRQSKTHDQELSQISVWMAASPTSEAAQKGDHMLLDYAGVLLKEDGSAATVSVETADGLKEIPDYFDGGSGKMFMLTNLVGGTLIPGFEEQLVGMKAGEGKEIQVQFPKDYGVDSLKDKMVKFTVYIHEVKKAFPNSPVGDLIDENQRIRSEAKAKAIADAQAQASAAKAAAEKALADAGVAPATTEGATEVQAAETPAESAPVETAAEKSDNSAGAEQTS